MWNVMRKNLWSHKRRLAGTGLAVLIGVAFLTGTLALGDTVRANFKTMFADANAGTSALVRSRAATTDDETGTAATLIDQSIASRVRGVDGVAGVQPSVEGFGQLLNSKGKPIGGNGPPTIAGTWIADATLNPFRVAEGRAPRTDNEVIINRGAAKTGHLRVGMTTLLQTPEPVPVKIVGLATFGTEDGIGPSTYTGFTLAGAQRYITKQPGRVTSLMVKGASGVSQAALVARINPVLPGGTEAVTGATLTKEATDGINKDFLDFFTTFLVLFAVIALLVATFSIHNTFTILAAQRTRESALLRALGATRRQVLGALTVEAISIGALASLAGIVGGMLFATGLKTLLHGFGMPIPAGGLTLTTGTIVTALIVGIGVTLVAGAAPAIRASRVAPLAALRDVAVESTTSSRLRLAVGVATTAIGFALVITAVLGDASGALPQAGLGALLSILGLVVSGPIVARRAAATIGAPLPRTRGITGTLARENSMRNPRRTAGTASALLVGVGVVTLFTVFAASMKGSIDKAVTGAFRGDLVVDAGTFGGTGFSPQLATEVAALPDVQTAIGFSWGNAKVDGKNAEMTVANLTRLTDVLDPDVASGDLATLGNHRIGVAEKVATENHWRLNQLVPVRFSDGVTEPFTIGAIYREGQLTGSYLIARSDFMPHAVQSIDSVLLVKLAPDASVSKARTDITAAAKPYGAPKVENRQQYVDSAAAGINMILGLVYVMLVLAIVIALMGIANTLSLAIYERRRELGLLRAVGGTRSQVRSMIRWESVIVALFGTLGGVGLGVFLGWGLVHAAASEMPSGAFAAPPGQLLTVLIVGGLVGAIAAIRPARRAARLDPLTAIAT